MASRALVFVALVAVFGSALELPAQESSDDGFGIPIWLEAFIASADSLRPARIVVREFERDTNGNAVTISTKKTLWDGRLRRFETVRDRIRVEGQLDEPSKSLAYWAWSDDGVAFRWVSGWPPGGEVATPFVPGSPDFKEIRGVFSASDPNDPNCWNIVELGIAPGLGGLTYQELFQRSKFSVREATNEEVGLLSPTFASPSFAVVIEESAIDSVVGKTLFFADVDSTWTLVGDRNRSGFTAVEAVGSEEGVVFPSRVRQHAAGRVVYWEVLEFDNEDPGEEVRPVEFFEGMVVDDQTRSDVGFTIWGRDGPDRFLTPKQYRDYISAPGSYGREYPAETLDGRGGGGWTLFLINGGLIVAVIGLFVLRRRWV